MNGILIIDKPKGITSRDVVNKVIKKFNTKKVGHTGTLDPIATGVLVVCIGSATKLVSLLTSNDKEYIASVTLGIETDSIDTEGKVLKDIECIKTKEEIINVLNSFKGSYDQAGCGTRWCLSCSATYSRNARVLSDSGGGMSRARCIYRQWVVARCEDVS